jgi:phosphate transport system substrate-binding protein
MIRKSGRVAAVLLALSLVAVACGDDSTATTTTPAASTTTAAATTTAAGATTTEAMNLSGTLDGAGATFPAPIYLEWIGEYQQVYPDVAINYQSIGSGGGVTNFTEQTVDFGASDAYLSDDELAAASANGTVYHIPMVFGAVTPAYNLPGVDSFTLDCDTLAAIFMGDITNWNDPALAALNPGVSFPDQAIQVVHRSDGSGTTNTFTLYLDLCNADWSATIGHGKTVEWPVGVGGEGNEGVSAAIAQQVGSIGYVELAYAIQSGLSTTKMMNKSGNTVEASLASTSAAAEGAQFPDDLRFILANTDAPQGWPIATATWILAYGNMPADKAELLRSFLHWALENGDATAESLDYAPIPDSLQQKALAFVDLIGNS